MGSFTTTKYQLTKSDEATVVRKTAEDTICEGVEVFISDIKTTEGVGSTVSKITDFLELLDDLDKGIYQISDV